MKPSIAILAALVIIFALLTPSIIAQEFPPPPIGTILPFEQNGQVQAQQSGSVTADIITFKSEVRWMDANIGQFGSSYNITFVNLDIFTSRWQIRFHLAANGTVIKEYWGSWTLVQLPHNWYQLVPHEDLRLDPSNTVYFSFNGDWDPSLGQVTPEILGMDAAEMQIAPRTSSEAPAVRKLEPSIEFLNAPFTADITNAPFDKFVRSQKASKAPGTQPGGFKVPPPGPTTNFLGLYICSPILLLAFGMFMAATFGRWRFRQHFRKQCQEREWVRRSGNDGPSSDPTNHHPTQMEGGQLKSDGGAVAEVYTHYAREQHRQSILQPGLAYRMSVYQAANDNESLRAGMKSPPLPELPRHGVWPQHNQLERIASPGYGPRTGTPHYPPPAMPLPRLPTPALHETHPLDNYHNDGTDLGMSGRMNYQEHR